MRISAPTPLPPSFGGRRGELAPEASGCTGIIAVVVVVVAIASSCAVVPATTTSLFDGKTLTGWRGDTSLWSVEDGAIVGRTDGSLAHNTFLIRDGVFSDFTLSLEFRLVNHNSGVQFRSHVVDESGFVVGGDQADIADDGVHMGTLSDEKGRGLLASADAAAVDAHTNAGDWNSYVIRAHGPQITLSINEFQTVDYREKQSDAATSGIIALQLHTGQAMEVDFRNLEVGGP